MRFGSTFLDEGIFEAVVSQRTPCLMWKYCQFSCIRIKLHLGHDSLVILKVPEPYGDIEDLHVLPDRMIMQKLP